MSNIRPNRSFKYPPKSQIKNFKFEEDFEKIRAKLLGSNTLFTDDIGIYDLGWGSEWRRPKQIVRRPLFINGRPHRFDSLQGHLGDCWLVSSIIALTKSSLISHVVPADQDFDHRYVGAFHFRIWVLGQWYDVVVDDRLPFNIKHNRPIYVHSRSGNVFWACLLEKAYYKVWLVKNSHKTYRDILTSGQTKTACQDLTGGIIEMVFTERIKLGEQFERWMVDVAWNEALLCCSTTFSGAHVREVGLSEYHAYAITKVFKRNYSRYSGLFLIRVMDPTGQKEWIGRWGDEDDTHWKEIDSSIRKELEYNIEQDGEAWMEEWNFKKYFGELSVCHVGPGQYISSRFNSCRNWDPKYWQTASFKGEWVPNLTAAGSHRIHRHENPQYVIRLEWAENDERQSQDPQVVMDLVQRSKIGRDQAVVGFYVYPLSEHVKLPLDQIFVMATIPVLATEFQIRSSSAALKLKPGRYGIIPCTDMSNVESQYLLRVYSECQIVTVVVSDTLSRSFPQEEEPSVDYDERLRKIFYCEAGKKGEVDYNGLKNVLGAMHSNSVFGVTSIIKFFLGILSFSWSSGYDTNDLAFTKDECRNMVAMLDMNRSGRIGFPEFCDLWAKITFWTKVYGQYEYEGLMKAAQLRNALGAMGYNIDMRTAHSLTYVYADDFGNITLRDFILCAISLQTVLNECQRDGQEMAAEYEFTTEEWVRKTLSL